MTEAVKKMIQFCKKLLKFTTLSIYDHTVILLLHVPVPENFQSVIKLTNFNLLWFICR